MAAFLAQYGVLIAAAVAIAGWQVSNWQANRRELRKEVRQDISDLRSAVERVCAGVREHQKHERSSREAALASVAVQQDFVLLELRLARIRERPRKSKSDVFVQEIRNNQERFFDLSTGDLIDGSVMLTPDQVQNLVTEQHVTAAQLEHGLMKFFFSEFDAH